MADAKNPTAMPANSRPVFEVGSEFEDRWKVFIEDKNKPFLENRTIRDLARLIAEFEAACNQLESPENWPSLTLLECTIEEATLQGEEVPFVIVIKDCEFKKAVKFSEVRFAQGVFFLNTRFAEEVAFTSVRFGELADFCAARFAGNIRADDCRFTNGLNVSHATFSGEFGFYQTTVESEADFSAAIFNHSAVFCDSRSEAEAPWVFSGTVFNGSADFDSNSLAGRVTFDGSKFNGPACIVNTCFDQNVSFKDATFKTALGLPWSRFKDSPLDLTTARFEPGVGAKNNKVALDIRKLQIGTGVLAADLLLRRDQLECIHILGEDPKDELAEPGRGAEEDEKAGAVALNPLEAAAQQYSALVGNFRAMAGPENIKTENYCRDKYETLSRKLRWPRAKELRHARGWWGAAPFHGLAYGLHWFFLCFGLQYFHNPWRILFSAAVIISFFTLLFMTSCFPVVKGVEGDTVAIHELHCGERVETALYFSSVSFTTIGYGDWRPVSWARAAAVAEGLMGLALTACFVVALTRRYTR